MAMRAIDHHAWTNRWRHRHPGERLLLAGGGLLLALVLPPLTAGPLLCALMATATVFGAGVPARAFWGVMALPAGFLLMSAPFLALSLDPGAVPPLVFSSAGALVALTVSLRALGALSCLAFLALTTPVSELLPWLRRLGVPQAVVEIALLTYRLIFIFMERAVAGQQAQAARQGYGSRRRSLRSLGALLATLFQRTLEQARRLETGLAARGFAGELRVLTPRRVLSRRRLAGIGGLLLAVALAAILLDRALDPPLNPALTPVPDRAPNLVLTPVPDRAPNLVLTPAPDRAPILALTPVPDPALAPE